VAATINVRVGVWVCMWVFMSVEMYLVLTNTKQEKHNNETTTQPVLITAHFVERLAVPISQELTLVAKRREQMVSWKLPAKGDTLTNMRVLLLPPREFWRR